MRRRGRGEVAWGCRLQYAVNEWKREAACSLANQHIPGEKRSPMHTRTSETSLSNPSTPRMSHIRSMIRAAGHTCHPLSIQTLTSTAPLRNPPSLSSPSRLVVPSQEFMSGPQLESPSETPTHAALLGNRERLCVEEG